MLQKIKERLEAKAANTKGVTKESAVILPLVQQEGEWHVLFEKRAFTLSSQPGEVCFPGGLLESNETPLEGAIRETCEELNIKEEAIEIIGQIDSILTNFDMIIHCYVGIIHAMPSEIKHSIDEVAFTFTVPIQYFLETPPEVHELKATFNPESSFPFHHIPDGKNYNFKQKSYPVVFYRYANENIWGLTARMVFNFIKTIQ